VKGLAAPVRAWIGIGVALWLCFSISLEYYSSVSEYYRQHPDPMGVGEQESRLAQVRAELPAASIVGYFSGLPIHKGGGSAAFFEALYTMAPRLLVLERARYRPELVLGNFTRRPDLGQLEREHGLKLIKDYGGGVRLFRRGGK